VLFYFEIPFIEITITENNDAMGQI